MTPPRDPRDDPPPTRDAPPPPDPTLPSLGPRGQAEEVPGSGPAGGEELPPAGRIRLEGVVGRGGMGVVYRAADRTLGRPVAVKVLRPEHSRRPEVTRRFLEEAQLTGRLQHPGVPPVHDAGTLPDGRPYFVMKLVGGRTLAELLAARPGLSHDREHFLTIFERVCQAVGYAHSRGVVHRDLKPANVMVGDYGEVQVMDWGLAKNLRASPDDRRPAGDAGSSTLYELPGGGTPDPTGVGAVLGTPAFMPPEQARGGAGRADERSDVFGLGALLCVLLTGRPPFDADSSEEALRRSRHADLGPAFSLLDACGADADLTGLARRCLAAEPQGRPRDGGTVAAAVALYRENVRERLRRAEVESAAEAARAEGERKRRRLVAGGSAAAVILLLTSGAGLAGWLQRRAEAGQAAAAAATDLGEAERARDARRWADARLALERASGRLPDGGPEPLRGRADRVRAELDLVSAVEEARLAGTATTPDGEFDGEARLRGYRAAFATYGIHPGGDPAASAARLPDSAARGPALAALSDWEWLGQDPGELTWLGGVLRAAADAEGGAAAAEWRRAVERRDARGLLRLATDPALADRDPADLDRMAAALEEVGALGAARRLLRAGLSRHPDDFALHYDLGSLELRARQPRPEDAVWHLTAAAALRPASHPARNNLGVALRQLGRPAEAEAELRAAVRLRPGDAEAHSNLGVALRDLGRHAEAEAEYRESLRLRPDNASARNNLGILLRLRGGQREAAEEFREALRLRPDFPEAHNNLGNALRALGDAAGAEEAYREAVRQLPEFPEAHLNLGNVLEDQGRFAEAAAELRRGHELGSRNPAWKYPSAERARAVERLAVLDARLPAFLRGDPRPTAGEALELAVLCQLPCRRRYAASAKFAADAFAASPRLADDLGRSSRYNAACAAALAGCGKGEDAAGLDEKDRARLRGQARDWLADDLAAWRKRLGDGVALDRALVVQTLGHWRKDDDLAGVRGEEALAKLPEGERAAWRKLWADVEALLKQARAAK